MVGLFGFTSSVRFVWVFSLWSVCLRKCFVRVASFGSVCLNWFIWADAWERLDAKYLKKILILKSVTYKVGNSCFLISNKFIDFSETIGFFFTFLIFVKSLKNKRIVTNLGHVLVTRFHITLKNFPGVWTNIYTSILLHNLFFKYGIFKTVKIENIDFEKFINSFETETRIDYLATY